MIKFSATSFEDQDRILDWATADPYHSSQALISGPGWWLTGSQCLMAARIDDSQGPVFYSRLDDEVDFVRLHIQFAPQEVVSRGRVAKAIIEALPMWETYAKTQGKQGIVFESISATLIVFGEKLGFERIGQSDDYVLRFQESQ